MVPLWIVCYSLQSTTTRSSWSLLGHKNYGLLDSLSRKKKKCLMPIHKHILHTIQERQEFPYIFSGNSLVRYVGKYYFSIWHRKRLNNSETEMTYLRGKVIRQNECQLFQLAWPDALSLFLALYQHTLASSEYIKIGLSNNLTSQCMSPFEKGPSSCVADVI